MHRPMDMSVQYELLFNQTESDTTIRTTEQGTRLDALVIVKGRVVGGGEVRMHLHP